MKAQNSEKAGQVSGSAKPSANARQREENSPPAAPAAKSRSKAPGSAASTAAQPSQLDGASDAAGRSGIVFGAPLRDEIREALLNVLRDKKSSAAAKASAGKTLLEHYGAAEEGANWLKPIGEMSESEIDRELELRKKAQ